MLAGTMLCASVVFAVDGGVLKGNPDSKVYHKPACHHYSAKGCVVEFKTEAEAKKAGYKPCKKCAEVKKAKAPVTPKKAPAPKK